MPTLRPEARLIALIVATAFFMQMLDTSIINTSLPQMAKSLGVIPLDLSVGITLYTLTAAALIPVSGWMADRLGARSVFVAAIIIFTLASLLCGLANELWQLTAARVLQGVGGSLMTPVGRMIVLRNARKEELLHATALITWPALAAPIIGPALGGFITTYISWRWNFLLNVPLGIAGVWMVLRHVPKTEPEHQQAFDWLGFALTSVALMLVLLGLETLSHAEVTWLMYQWLQPMMLTLLGLGLGVLAVRHLLRVARPLMMLTPLAVPTFRIAAASVGMVFRMAIHATPFLLPLLFQIGFGMSALQAGSLLLCYFVGNLSIKPITTPLLQRFGFRPVLLVNGMAAGLSIAACAALDAESSAILTSVLLLLTGATRSIQLTCLNTLTFADTSDTQRSSATTLFSMFNQAAATLGVALATLIMNLSVLATHHTQANAADIRLALLVVGGWTALSALAYLRLSPTAGAAVSGATHSAPTATAKRI